jgi:hypothetical protein
MENPIHILTEHLEIGGTYFCPQKKERYGVLAEKTFLGFENEEKRTSYYKLTFVKYEGNTHYEIIVFRQGTDIFYPIREPEISAMEIGTSNV